MSSFGVMLSFPSPLSKLAGMEFAGWREMGHFQGLGWGCGVEVGVVLSRLPDQGKEICSAAPASIGGGWKG